MSICDPKFYWHISRIYLHLFSTDKKVLADSSANTLISSLLEGFMTDSTCNLCVSLSGTKQEHTVFNDEQVKTVKSSDFPVFWFISFDIAKITNFGGLFSYILW